jgi:hypothetical protein
VNRAEWGVPGSRPDPLYFIFTWNARPLQPKCVGFFTTTPILKNFHAMFGRRVFDTPRDGK